MLSFYVTNKRGETLEITNNSNYGVIDIDGLAPTDATINTSHDVGADGSVFNSSYQNDRTITVTLAINYPAEENRLALFKYFRPKSNCRLRIVTDTRDVWIDAYVQRLPVNMFKKKQTAQIVMTCPKPLFNGSQKGGTMTETHPLFEFPFEAPLELSETGETEVEVRNNGDVETGAEFIVYALGNVSRPSISNRSTGESFAVEVDLEAGESLVVSTVEKEKAVYINTNGGEQRSVAGSFVGDWMQIEPGRNELVLSVSGMAQVDVSFTEKYEGV